MEYDLKPLARLVDLKYDREARLNAVDISAFVPALRFQESLADDPEVLREYRDFVNRSQRNHIVKDAGFSSEILKLNQQASERQKATGNYWDFKHTELERRYWRQLITQSVAMQESVGPYKSEVEDLCRGELIRFNKGYVAGVRARSKKQPDAKVIYMGLVGVGLKGYEFELDDNVISRTHLAYSRPITENLKVRLVVDLQNLRQRVGSPMQDSRSGEILPPPGPSLNVWIELYDAVNRKSVSNIMLDWLFPIREFPLGLNCYSKFYQPDELESLINMHLAMYFTIARELDQALTTVVRNSEV